MDAPKGRYSVVEKDGRLVVIDNGTGTAIPSSVAPPPGGRGGLPAGPVGPAGPGFLDRAGDALLKLAVKRWDSDGRAVIAWKWEQNGREKRWDALLDEGQQRRLGRALLATIAPPLVLVFLSWVDSALAVFAAVIVLPALFWGIAAVQRLYRETNGSSSSTR